MTDIIPIEFLDAVEIAVSLVGRQAAMCSEPSRYEITEVIVMLYDI